MICATFEAVVVFPVRLAQLVLPAMKARGSGAFVFVTSARETRPEPGFAVPTTLRAATTTFAKALAKEAAPFGVQANVVGPNYLYSEMYYPRARFIDDPAGRVAAGPSLARRLAILASIPGVGEATAIALMPELGQMDAKRAASLSGSLLSPADPEPSAARARSAAAAPTCARRSTCRPW